MQWTLTILLAVAFASCSASEVDEPPSDPVQEARVEPAEPPAPALPNGAELLRGEFEYVATHHGREIRRSLRVHDRNFTRLVDGGVTATGSFDVVTTEAGRVTVEVAEEGRTPIRRTFAFLDDDRMFDVVTPDLVFERTDFEPPNAPGPDGSGASALGE